MVHLKCCHCQSERLVKFGFAPNGKQRYRCRACGRTSRESPQSQGHEAAFREQILAAYNERMSLRGIQRAFGVSRQTVSCWLKKRPTDAGAPKSNGRAVSE